MPSADIALGLDIGGTRIKAGLVDSAGTLLRTESTPTPLGISSLRVSLRSLLRPLIAGTSITGVGAGCKGVIDPATTRIECQPGVMNYVEGFVLSELVAEAIGAPVPVFADNDARVTLVGECVWGAARGRSDVLLFTLGTGVGGAILSGGRILRGHGGIAGHLGHITVDLDGPPCICGNRGCLESVFSARTIEVDAFSAIRRGLIARFPGATTDPPSCAEVFGAARDGDPIARWIVDTGVRKLGGAIAGLLHALDPEIVILGGQIVSAGDTLFAPLREEIAWRTRTLLRREVPVVPMQVDDPSGVLGAAALVFKR